MAGNLNFLERLFIPTYNNQKQTKYGEVEFNYDTCTGCGNCARVCPSNAILMVEKNPEMLPRKENVCMFCGACMALCQEDAIRMKSPFLYTRFYKTFNQGEIKPPRL